MKRNRDPRLNQQLDDAEIDESGRRGHRRPGTITKLTALATATAAAVTFVAACGSGGSPKAGRTSPVAVGSRVPGTTGPSPESTPTATPKPTQSSKIPPLASACLRFSSMVFERAGTDLGYASEADALANCKTFPSSYHGFDPHVTGEAVNWAGNGLTARVMFQVVRNDPQGRIFSALKSEGTHAASVDGLPAEVGTASGTYLGMARDNATGVDYMITAFSTSNPPDSDPITAAGPKIFSDLLAGAINPS